MGEPTAEQVVMLAVHRFNMLRHADRWLAQGDLLEALLAAFQEKLGFLDTQVLQVFDGSLFGGVFKAADKIAHAQAEPTTSCLPCGHY